jgi:hypothetical protein
MWRHFIQSTNTACTVHSAWFDVGYGGCCYGIFSAACPVKALHALKNGLMSDCLNIP